MIEKKKMKYYRKLISRFSFLTIIAIFSFLYPHKVLASSEFQPPHEKISPVTSTGLTPAQQYSGELLAYLLKVVLGRAGQPKSRAAWRTRAGDETLDFDHIVKTMTDPEKNRLDFMVLDPDILDLSQVLFHYDDKLSLYKGDYGVTSVYPAPEILALRLFVLKKMNAGEKFDLDAFMGRKAKLLDKDYRTSPGDLAATRLSAGEMKFLRDIFQSEPAFYRYLTSPFLLKELKDTNVLASGNMTDKIIQSAHYTPFRGALTSFSEPNRAVRIAFLPSMTKEFAYGKDEPSLSEYGFQPTDFLKKIFIKLQKEILETTLKTIQTIFSKPPYTKLTKSQWHELWQRLSQKDIAFYVENKRPLVIYPENAAKVIREVCPEADFTIILMGKNIYRAIYFGPTKDAYHFVNRIYIDIMDVEYDQAGEEIEIISQFICSRLQNRIAMMIDHMTK
jgi:hypothetical protein